jgi:hypothetical protein
MQQPCPRCGYISDRPARFCRQCGVPLFTESEATSAATRQHSPHPTADPYADAPYRSPYAQSGRLDEQTPETSRFYRPPMAPNYAGYPVGETKKSNAWKWVLIALLCFLLVGGGIGLMVVSAIRAKRGFENIVPVQEIEAQVREQIEQEIERAKQERERAIEEIRRAQEESGANAPPPPPPLPPAPGELPPGLQPYKYPNAEVSESATVVGNEFVKLLTDDSVGKVRDYYRKQIGEPLIKGKGEHGESVIFQIPGSPSIIITINEDDENPGKTEINVIRSRFQLPKLH